MKYLKARGNLAERKARDRHFQIPTRLGPVYLGRSVRIEMHYIFMDA